MRILLVRLDGIGDALACAPLVAALRAAGHELGVALSQANAAIFSETAFEWTHVLRRNPWPAHGHAREDVSATIASARRIGYELALIASEEPDAYALAAGCAPRRVGFVNGWEKPLKSLRARRFLDRAIVRPASLSRHTEHEVETLFRLGGRLFDERTPTRDLARLRPLVVGGGGETERGEYLALQLGPKWDAAGIERAVLARLEAALVEVLPVQRLGANDRTGFASEDEMRAWKRTIAAARVLVTPDGGAAHVAGMTGTPCVDLFPAGAHLRAQMRRWAPWASRSALLVADRDAPVVSAARELCARS
ncbi:MAG: hypothetical protein JO359_14695 [Candidatus Eremiobacteraeota bacterium]|nr:hypothetical protein [Candidatus Eremiobacteraeota bacterium]